MNAKQRRALIIGVMGFIAIGGFPPWKDTSPAPAGTPLAFAPIALPPVIEGHSIEVDVVRLGIMWILMVVVTAASLFMAKGSDEPRAPRELNILPTVDAEEILRNAASVKAKSSGKQILDAITLDAKTTGASGKGNSSAQSESMRLKFPERKVGELLTEDEEDPEFWQFITDARGRVEVSQGRRLQLELAKEGQASLEFLSSMGNKEARSAIVSLDLSETELEVESLSYLRYLPGLEELDLSGTSVGDEDLDAIVSLPNLKKLWLDDTPTSKAAAEKLSNISGLKKLSLSHLDGNEVEINSLKLRIPSCEVVVREGKN